MKPKADNTLSDGRQVGMPEFVETLLRGGAYHISGTIIFNANNNSIDFQGCTFTPIDPSKVASGNVIAEL